MKKKSAGNSHDKLAWEWVYENDIEDVTKDNILTSYRLFLPPCKLCRKNCSGNPLCLRGIGEAQWLRADNDKTKTTNNQISELLSESRAPDEFVGLRNLGATCYVNTFLQLWFNNVQFRTAIYQCSIDSSSDDVSSEVCKNLRHVFGLLQSGNKSFVDPSSLIQCLGLDTGLQQDAQEFSKLLINLLENKPHIGQMIWKEFRGEYQYITKCHHCKTSSYRSSEFYELDLNIQGCSSLTKSLAAFLKEEELTGDNQYFCGSCQRKQNALRSIALRTLPPTLNLQLLRFVYDRKTMRKKKLSSNLSFPTVLDMSEFVGKEKDSVLYHLAAVLVHRGPSASSGHYVALIKDSFTHDWYQFNDEAVARTKNGKNLVLGSSYDDHDFSESETPPAKKPRKPGVHNSKDAYMLVYKRQGAENVTSSLVEVPVLPEDIQKYVDEENQKHDEFVANEEKSILMKDVENKLFEDKMKNFVNILYAGKPVDHDSGYFVPVQWLKHLLDPKTRGNPIKKFDLVKYMCKHGGVNIDAAKVCKFISGDAMLALCDFVSTLDAPIFSLTKLCERCIKAKCGYLRNVRQLSRDHEQVDRILKEDPDEDDIGYYMDGKSLRYWKFLVQRKLQETFNAETMITVEEKQHCEDDEGNSSDDEFEFNCGVLCIHNLLTTSVGKLKIVPTSVWRTISTNFTNPPTFTSDQEPCSSCQKLLDHEEQELCRRKARANDQRQLLADLFHNRNRPSFNHKNELADIEAYVVSSTFIDKWRSFVRNPLRSERVSPVNNAQFLCEHNLLSTDPLSAHNENGSMVVLWSYEWDVINMYYDVDCAISVKRYSAQVCLKRLECSEEDQPFTSSQVARIENGETNGHQETDIIANVVSTNNVPEIKTKPAICHKCLLVNQQLEIQRRCVYSDAPIYIRKAESPDISFEESQLENGWNETKKRRKRVGTNRNEKVVRISSNETLKDFKIKLMPVFNIMPIDQNIWMSSCKLSDNEASFEQLQVLPGTSLVLVADQPQDEAMLDHENSSKEVEKGFQGTGLLAM